MKTNAKIPINPILNYTGFHKIFSRKIPFLQASWQKSTRG